MTIKLNITKFEKGPTLKLFVVVTSDTTDITTSALSEPFEIPALAMVRLKSTIINKSNSHTVSISAKKHESVQDPAVRLFVSCDAVAYADNWTCSVPWTDWINLGQIAGDEIYNRTENYRSHIVYMSIIQINISVKTIICTSVLTKLYDDADMTDFHLITQDGAVAVHKAMLAVHSSVFKTMFTGEWKETKENLFMIKDFTLQTIQHLKDFLYLGILPEEGLRPLLALAVMYGVDRLAKECSWKLAETAKSEDLYSLHEFACENNIPELSYALT